MLADLHVISGQGVPHPFEPVLLLGLHCIGGSSHGAFRNGISEDTLHFLGVVNAESGLEVQALQGVDIEVSVTEHSPVCIAVVLVPCKAGEGILAVCITAHRSCKFAAGCINGN